MGVQIDGVDEQLTKVISSIFFINTFSDELVVCRLLYLLKIIWRVAIIDSHDITNEFEINAFSVSFLPA